MKYLYISFFLALVFFNVKAQDKALKNLEEAKALSQKVTKLFYENQIAASVKEMQPYWPLPSNEIESFEEKTIKNMNMLENRYGKPIGSLKVKEMTIKDIALRETYLIRFQYSAIRLIFTYYKNNSGWIINSFKWDDSFEEEFN